MGGRQSVCACTSTRECHAAACGPGVAATVLHAADQQRADVAGTHLLFVQEGLQALLKRGKGAGGVGLREDLIVAAIRATRPQAQARIRAADVTGDDGVRLGGVAGCRRGATHGKRGCTPVSEEQHCCACPPGRIRCQQPAVLVAVVVAVVCITQQPTHPRACCAVGLCLDPQLCCTSAAAPAHCCSCCARLAARAPLMLCDGIAIAISMAKTPPLHWCDWFAAPNQLVSVAMILQIKPCSECCFSPPPNTAHNLREKRNVKFRSVCLRAVDSALLLCAARNSHVLHVTWTPLSTLGQASTPLQSRNAQGSVVGCMLYKGHLTSHTGLRQKTMAGRQGGQTSVQTAVW